MMCFWANYIKYHQVGIKLFCVWQSVQHQLLWTSCDKSKTSANYVSASANRMLQIWN